MSLPAELRVLCFQLSSTPTADLPRLLPTSLRHVLRCQIPLSSPSGNATKADASASSVLVHKLRTLLSTLLHGRSPEGRFVAVVLIKAVVEVGGWEVLHDSKSWVQGLLSVLGKPEAAATKEMCVVTLTKIYCMTHHYQTLVREITTPTLPAFVTSCLGLVSSRLSSKGHDIPSSLEELVFRSFAMLVPRHTTIFRPFIMQIRIATRPYIAPTSSDGLFVTQSLQESARRLVVALPQTVPKNGGGEEWAKSVRELIKDIHVTADNVFRAVVEDWESVTGYNSQTVDVNQPAQGGGTSDQDLPPWTGIFAGTERLVGMLEMLSEYLCGATSTPVTLPVGAIVDMAARMLSIAIPLSTDAPNKHGGVRLHPAIDRDERDGLWTGMPQIYVATLQLVDTLAERLEGNFVSIAQGSFDQLAWVFPFGKHNAEFRTIAYKLTSRIISHIGHGMEQIQIRKFATILQSCCSDLASGYGSDLAGVFNGNGNGNATRPGATAGTHNADAVLSGASGSSLDVFSPMDPALVLAAGHLLPLLISGLPQHYMHPQNRFQIERTAILTHDKETMLACILNQFVGKSGKTLPSAMPHIVRAYGGHDVVELLLRPRMPVLPSKDAAAFANEAADEEGFEDEDMEVQQEDAVEDAPSRQRVAPLHHSTGSSDRESGLDDTGPIPYKSPAPLETPPTQSAFGSSSNPVFPSVSSTTMSSMISAPTVTGGHQQDIKMIEDDASSDDESVHLNMELDTDDED